MRALAAAVIVFAGATLMVAEVLTGHLHPDRWGVVVGFPLTCFGLLGWLVEMFRRDANGQPKV